MELRKAPEVYIYEFSTETIKSDSTARLGAKGDPRQGNPMQYDLSSQCNTTCASGGLLYSGSILEAAEHAGVPAGTITGLFSPTVPVIASAPTVGDSVTGPCKRETHVRQKHICS